MLLNEILDVKMRIPSKDHVNGNIGAFDEIKEKLPRNSIAGSGVEAIVFQSKRAQNAGIVTKWLRNQSTDSKLNNSIQYLIQSQQQNSTYAPKVYNITQYQRPNNAYDFSIQMERLAYTMNSYIDSHRDDHLIMSQFLSQLFEEHYAQKLADIKWSDMKNWMFSKHVCSSLRSKTHLPILPRLRKYLSFAENLVHKDSELDMHGENVMVRITSVGPQVVFTDIVFGNYYDA